MSCVIGGTYLKVERSDLLNWIFFENNDSSLSETDSKKKNVESKFNWIKGMVTLIKTSEYFLETMKFVFQIGGLTNHKVMCTADDKIFMLIKLASLSRNR